MNPEQENNARLLAYLRGELGAEESSALEQELKEDAALRKSLLEIAAEEAALTEWAKTDQVAIQLEDQTFNDDPMPGAEAGAMAQFPTIARPSAWLAAAAVIALLGLAVGFWMPRNQEAAVPTGVAQLVASTDAQWGQDAPAMNPGMPAGSYELERGAIDLVFADGARVSLSAPASFELKSARHLHLSSGNLVAQIPDEALGFIVTSPQSEVVDLGTEFGLSVDETGRTDVHVLDGLVEVLAAKPGDSTNGVTIAEGQARRFDNRPGTASNEIPVASRETLLGMSHFDGLGLKMLRGSVRIAEGLTASDFTKKAIGGNWIDLMAEKRAVILSEPLAVSIDSTGSYRDFATLDQTIPPGARLDSYLLHFRPGSLEQVRGVIRFDQPIVAILCTGKHLNDSDTLFGVPSVVYPNGVNPFRGLEPNGHPTKLNSQDTDPDWQPDEIILSQDRHTISIGAFANTERGYDQIRILTKAEESN